MEAAAGLDYLHSRLCIHRDIAARNLLIDKVAKVRSKFKDQRSIFLRSEIKDQPLLED